MKGSKSTNCSGTYLDPQTTHKNGRSPTTILGLKPIFQLDLFEGDYSPVNTYKQPFHHGLQEILRLQVDSNPMSLGKNPLRGVPTPHRPNRAAPLALLGAEALLEPDRREGGSENGKGAVVEMEPTDL